jgi:hypothetical protein
MTQSLVFELSNHGEVRTYPLGCVVDAILPSMLSLVSPNFALNLRV